MLILQCVFGNVSGFREALGVGPINQDILSGLVMAPSFLTPEK